MIHELPAFQSLGIDGASLAGALVHLSAPTVAASATWWHRKKKGLPYRVLTATRLPSGHMRVVDGRADTPIELGQLVAQRHATAMRAKLTVEDVVIGFKNPRTSFEILRAACLVAAPVALGCGDFDPHFVKATVWRHKVLGLAPRTRRLEAKAQVIKQLGVRIVGLKDLEEMIRSKTRKRTLIDDIYDAGGVGAYRYLCEA